MYVMVAQITGSRDGQDWPRPGERVDFLTEEEAQHMASIGHVRRVADPEPLLEKAVAPEPETRSRRASRKSTA